MQVILMSFSLSIDPRGSLSEEISIWELQISQWALDIEQRRKQKAVQGHLADEN